jgi:hypothetical protein
VLRVEGRRLRRTLGDSGTGRIQVEAAEDGACGVEVRWRGVPLRLAAVVGDVDLGVVVCLLVCGIVPLVGANLLAGAPEAGPG